MSCLMGTTALGCPSCSQEPLPLGCMGPGKGQGGGQPLQPSGTPASAPPPLGLPPPPKTSVPQLGGMNGGCRGWRDAVRAGGCYVDCAKAQMGGGGVYPNLSQVYTGRGPPTAQNPGVRRARRSRVLPQGFPTPSQSTSCPSPAQPQDSKAGAQRAAGPRSDGACNPPRLPPPRPRPRPHCRNKTPDTAFSSRFIRFPFLECSPSHSSGEAVESRFWPGPLAPSCPGRGCPAQPWSEAGPGGQIPALQATLAPAQRYPDAPA